MSLVSNERIKLSAADSNTATSGLLTAGGVAPLVAVAFLDLRADRTGP